MFGDTGTKVNNIIFYYSTLNPDLIVSIYLDKIRGDEDCHNGKGRRDDEYHIENEFHQFHLPKEVRKVVLDLLKNSRKGGKEFNEETLTLKGQMKDGKPFEIVFNPTTIENPKPPRSITIDGKEQLSLPQPRKAVL